MWKPKRLLGGSAFFLFYWDVSINFHLDHLLSTDSRGGNSYQENEKGVQNSLQFCPTLCDLWTVALPGSTTMGFSEQVYWTEVAISFCKGSFKAGQTWSPVVSDFTSWVQSWRRSFQIDRWKNFMDLLYKYFWKIQSTIRSLLPYVHVYMCIFVVFN